MQPNQTVPPPTAPPSGGFDSSQFDFIMNPGQKPKKSLVPGLGGSKSRLILMIAGGVILIMLLVIIGTYLFGGSKGGVNDQLISVAQKQQEIIRIAAIGVDKAGSSEAKKLAITTKMTITTDQKYITDYLLKQKTKVSGKELSRGFNAKSTQELETAEVNGRFDEVFTRIITDSLRDYQNSMQSAYNATQNQQTKELLSYTINNVPLLLEEQTASS